MRDSTGGARLAGEEIAASRARSYKRDFWVKENLKHVRAHYRLRKAARLVNKIAGSSECDLLDVGCGPATFMTLLNKNIHYYGIDIAIHEPAPNLIEADFLEVPIGFGDRQFDIVVAQGVFEYVGDLQGQKFAEVASLLKEGGTFIVSYTNFGHHKAHVFEAFSNVQVISEFRKSLQTYFNIEKSYPASHNWRGGQPTRRSVMAANMFVNFNIPFFSPTFGVEYFFICSPLSYDAGITK